MVIAIATQLLTLVAITVAAVLVGQLVAWVAHKYTLLAAFNLYPPLGVAGLVLSGGVLLGSSVLVTASAVALIAITATLSTALRRRNHALGAGGGLRHHELARRWAFSAKPARGAGERVYLGKQDEVMHVTPWSEDIPYVSMQSGTRGDRGPRLPLGDGQHIFLVGATGAGKTTTARRVLAARVLNQGSSLAILDQKGDPGDVAAMRHLAAAAGVPFVLFDSQDEQTDRWQPLWGSPDMVAARATEAIKESEPYYYAVLRKHLDVVCKVLYVADLWPPSVPYLIDACEPVNYPVLCGLAEQFGPEHDALARRVRHHKRWVDSRSGGEDLLGATLRIEAALALASSRVVTPRVTSDGETVGVRLVDALRSRAVVMWRTHADTMPDEAAALTAIALADLHAAAEHDVGSWTLLLDEFGAVISSTADRALAILQRGRSHHGQAVVITQSVADVDALTETTGLLDSLTDNFAAIVAHRQTSPDSRDWLARLMGTRELWQSTDQTDSHGTRRSGRGSSRRVHEFRVDPDVFATLARGEAVIYTPEGQQADRAQVTPFTAPAVEPDRIDLTGPRDPIEMAVHAEQILARRRHHHTPAPTEPNEASDPDDLDLDFDDAESSPEPRDDPDNDAFRHI